MYSTGFAVGSYFKAKRCAGVYRACRRFLPRWSEGSSPKCGRKAGGCSPQGWSLQPIAVPLWFQTAEVAPYPLIFSYTSVLCVETRLTESCSFQVLNRAKFCDLNRHSCEVSRVLLSCSSSDLSLQSRGRGLYKDK